jgi:hypothetical protein
MIEALQNNCVNMESEFPNTTAFTSLDGKGRPSQEHTPVFQPVLPLREAGFPESEKERSIGPQKAWKHVKCQKKLRVGGPKAVGRFRVRKESDRIG